LSRVLTAPCAGSSGLPKLAACAAVAAPAMPLAAVAASMLRREIMGLPAHHHRWIRDPIYTARTPLLVNRLIPISFQYR
jgi:hypothetical protein